DPPMLVKAPVLRGHERIDDVRRNLLVRYPRAILEGIARELFVVGRVSDGRELEIRVVELSEARQIIAEEQRPDTQEEQHGKQTAADDGHHRRRLSLLRVIKLAMKVPADASAGTSRRPFPADGGITEVAIQLVVRVFPVGHSPSGAIPL